MDQGSKLSSWYFRFQAPHFLSADVGITVRILTFALVTLLRPLESVFVRLLGTVAQIILVGQKIDYLWVSGLLGSVPGG